MINAGVSEYLHEQGVLLSTSMPTTTTVNSTIGPGTAIPTNQNAVATSAAPAVAQLANLILYVPGGILLLVFLCGAIIASKYCYNRKTRSRHRVICGNPADNIRNRTSSSASQSTSNEPLRSAVFVNKFAEDSEVKFLSDKNYREQGMLTNPLRSVPPPLPARPQDQGSNNYYEELPSKHAAQANPLYGDETSSSSKAGKHPAQVNPLYTDMSRRCTGNWPQNGEQDDIDNPAYGAFSEMVLAPSLKHSKTQGNPSSIAACGCSAVEHAYEAPQHASAAASAMPDLYESLANLPGVGCGSVRGR